MPPVAVRVVEYAVPTVPDGSEVVVIASAATAVPLSDTACGLAAALSVNVMAPVGVPAAVGVKVTETVQLALAARLVPQVLVSAKLADAAMLLIERAARSGVLEGNCLSRAGGPDCLAGKGQAGGRQAHSRRRRRRYCGTAQRHRRAG